MKGQGVGALSSVERAEALTWTRIAAWTGNVSVGLRMTDRGLCQRPAWVWLSRCSRFKVQVGALRVDQAEAYRAVTVVSAWRMPWPRAAWT